jgi:hypothetical protein
MDELIHIRQVQLQFFEKLLMLEQRIRCNFLPRAFDQFERSIAPDIYWPVIDDGTAVDFTMKRHKIIQEAKRELVNIHVDAYEARIRHYERRYQAVLNDFNVTIATSLNGHECDSLDSIVTYMNHRTDRMKNEIYCKVTRCRRNLARSRQRASSSRKNVVGVCPEVIVDVNHVPLSAGELKYLSRGIPHGSCLFCFYTRMLMRTLLCCFVSHTRARLHKTEPNVHRFTISSREIDRKRTKEDHETNHRFSHENTNDGSFVSRVQTLRELPTRLSRVPIHGRITVGRSDSCLSRISHGQVDCSKTETSQIDTSSNRQEWYSSHRSSE